MKTIQTSPTETFTIRYDFEHGILWREAQRKVSNHPNNNRIMQAALIGPSGAGCFEFGGATSSDDDETDSQALGFADGEYTRFLVTVSQDRTKAWWTDRSDPLSLSWVGPVSLTEARHSIAVQMADMLKAARNSCVQEELSP